MKISELLGSLKSLEGDLPKIRKHLEQLDKVQGDPKKSEDELSKLKKQIDQKQVKDVVEALKKNQNKFKDGLKQVIQNIR